MDDHSKMPIERTAIEARGAVTGHNVQNVLFVSLGMVVILFAVMLAYTFLR